MGCLISLLLLGPLCGPGQPLYGENMVKLSSTIGPVDAGIIQLLTNTYEKKSGIKVTFEAAGTWATLEKAKTGNFDLVIVHARSLEDKFINDGYGMERRDIMYNDFVILGPKDDPAKIKGTKTAVEAFAKIATFAETNANTTKFVTRGDQSGTHVKELEVWNKAGLSPDSEKNKWYLTFEEGNRGNAHTTLFANSINAYTLMDRATYIIQKNNISLTILLGNDTVLINYIASILVNPEKFPNVNSRGAKDFVDWLCGDEAQTIIRDFEVEKYHEPLFFPNSNEWNKSHKKV